jgi:hypothetical protein
LRNISCLVSPIRDHALWNGPPLLPAMYARRHFQEEEWE